MPASKSATECLTVVCQEVNRECVQKRKGKKSRGTGVGTCPKEAGGAPLSPRALASMAESVLMAAVPRLSTATIASDRGDSSGSRVADRMGHLAMPGTTAVPEIPSVMTAAKAWRRAMEAMLHMEMLLLLMAPAVVSCRPPPSRCLCFRGRPWPIGTLRFDSCVRAGGGLRVRRSPAAVEASRAGFAA